MSGLTDFPGAMVVTHLPYWLIAVYIVIAVRRTRRSLESLVRELEERGPGRS